MSATTGLYITGILTTILGVVALATPMVAGAAVVIVLGILLLIAGIGQVIAGINAHDWSTKLAGTILGAISILAACGLLAHPIIGMAMLTMLMAIFFMIQGAWKIFASFSYRPAQGWMLLLFSGVVTLLLGGLIYVQWPFSGMFAIGMLLGVNLLMTGIAILSIAMTLTAIKKDVVEA